MAGLLLHICCAPCAVYPLEWLLENRPDLETEGWFYNPNIHPGEEFRRRRDSLAYLALQRGLKVDFSPPYEASAFLAALSAGPESTESPAPESPAPESPARCRLCYAWRLNAAARETARRGLRLFATTLAYSKRQKTGLIIEEGRRAAAAHGVEFLHEDWRSGWNRGRELTKALGLYRQTHCGCLFSELERPRNV